MTELENYLFLRWCLNQEQATEKNSESSEEKAGRREGGLTSQSGKSPAAMAEGEGRRWPEGRVRQGSRQLRGQAAEVRTGGDLRDRQGWARGGLTRHCDT